MGSTNKTTNLQLNQWVGTDTPQMVDFNEDNQKIDQAIGDLQADVTALEGGESANSLLTKIKTVDGSGSGLDADTLDGQQGSYYLPASTYTASDLLAKIKTVDGTSSGLDADLLDGQQGSYYRNADQVDGLHFRNTNGYLEYSTDGAVWKQVIEMNERVHDINLSATQQRDTCVKAYNGRWELGPNTKSPTLKTQSTITTVYDCTASSKGIKFLSGYIEKGAAIKSFSIWASVSGAARTLTVTVYNRTIGTTLYQVSGVSVSPTTATKYTFTPDYPLEYANTDVIEIVLQGSSSTVNTWGNAADTIANVVATSGGVDQTGYEIGFEVNFCSTATTATVTETIIPNLIEKWGKVNIAKTTPGSSSVTVKVYSVSDVLLATLSDDMDLGSTVDAKSYSAIKIKTTLTADGINLPLLHYRGLSYYGTPAVDVTVA